MENGDGTSNADDTERVERVQCLKREAVSNGVEIADGNGVDESEESQSWKSEAVNNGVAAADGLDAAAAAEGDSGGLENFRTYKRRKHVKSSSDSKVQEDFREYVEAASHLVDQETFKIDKDRQECSSQLEWLSHRIRCEANGHANGICNESYSQLDGHGMTEMCQRVLCNILTSEKFGSLCKVLLENFQGIKPESVFDFSVMNSRMKEQAYEQSPTLFLSDIQQVWRKLQDTGNEIVALAKSLSRMSRTSYCEQVGVSAHSTFKDEKQGFYNRESNSHMKPEQTEEFATYKICTCRRCGDKADDMDCLVCDSCEEVYHLSCIEPAVKEIPHKSWYCANCTVGGVVSPHENCAVCETLNDPRTLNSIVGDESLPTNVEMLNELEENSNCTDDGIQVSIGGTNPPNCKICGNYVDGRKIKICGHSFCPSKYYHVRCLTSKQLKTYGHCWYCPSCLCRFCFTDRDDDQIVLCDGCDHAYHIYCMKPPRTSIPRGNWFCRKCDAGIQAVRHAKKVYEHNKWRTVETVTKPSDNLEKKWNNKRERELEKGGGMDMLLTAANTLNFEENLASTLSRREHEFS